MKSGKKLYELSPGELANLNDGGVSRMFIHGECRRHCQLYVQSKGKDTVHLWRAWRTARALGDIPPECMRLLVPHLDALAVAPKNPKRAEQRELKNFMIANYYHGIEVMSDGRGTAKTKKQVRERVAKNYDTTEAVVKMAIMEHEGRKGRGKKTGRR